MIWMPMLVFRNICMPSAAPNAIKMMMYTMYRHRYLLRDEMYRPASEHTTSRAVNS